jgi:putative hydrolase of HD superfamily
MDATLKQQMEFSKTADELKSVYRQTLLINQSRYENVAEHSWHIALIAMTLFEHSSLPDVNLCRVLKMLTVHDLVEIYAGDVPAFSGVDKNAKLKMEQQAAEKIFGTLPASQAKEYRELWEEFDRMDTSDSLYAAATDRFWPFIANHLNEGHTWIKFNATAAQVYERMNPVKIVFPALWGFVQTAVKEAIENGYIKGEIT